MLLYRIMRADDYMLCCAGIKGLLGIPAEKMRNKVTKWILVAGARPNFMKIAPIIRAIKKHNVERRTLNIAQTLVHTGQHYDINMSDFFFKDLNLPQPNIHLGDGSGTHAEQTGKVMIEFEKVLFKEQPDLVIVVGDVNSTLACALAAVKLQMPVAHVEAGLRSFDKTMPEEINRLLTDAISNYLFTFSPDADENLKKEGIPEEKIFLVGNVMADSLLFNLEKAKKTSILERLNLTSNQQPTCNNLQYSIDNCQSIQPYALLTLHRPSNVDNKDVLLRIISALTEISTRIPVIFPAHPRTRKQIEAFGFQSYFLCSSKGSQITNNGAYLLNPLGYLDFLNLMMHSEFVMTDSGGIQEESTVLGIPCLTLRDTTERPITITVGTNVLVRSDTEMIVDGAFKAMHAKGKKGTCPQMWDGRASERIVKILANNSRVSPTVSFGS